MSLYTVVYEGTIREVYSVEAESLEDARKRWTHGILEVSEMIDGEVSEVYEDHDY